jgi:hypothetical protein
MAFSCLYSWIGKSNRYQNVALLEYNQYLYKALSYVIASTVSWTSSIATASALPKCQSLHPEAPAGQDKSIIATASSKAPCQLVADLSSRLGFRRCLQSASIWKERRWEHARKIRFSQLLHGNCKHLTEGAHADKAEAT